MQRHFLNHIANLSKLRRTLHRRNKTQQESGATIQLIDKAIIQPRHQHYSSDGFLVYDDGVFLPTGDPVRLAKHWRGHQYMNSPEYRGAPARHQEGEFIFGGWLFGRHFGHCVVESLGRLWATQHLNCGSKTILFLPGFGLNQKVPSFFREIVRNLGIKSSIEIVHEPISVDQLFVPSQLFGLGREYKAIPEFLKFVHQLRHCSATRQTPMKKRCKLFISRSRLKIGKGGILCEGRLDDLFKRSGYEVIHPELLTIDEQLRIYTSAETLVFSEGSAVHFFAFFAKPDQRVAIVTRRRNPIGLQRQIANFGGSKPVILTNINYWVIPDSRTGRRYPQASALAAIDFEAIAASLVKFGFINKTTAWCNPGETEVHAEIQRIAHGINGDVHITRELPKAKVFGPPASPKIA